MNILVLNCGSSSIKYRLLDMSESSKTTAKGIAERIGQPEGLLIHKPENKADVELKQHFGCHEEGINAILSALTDSRHGVVDDIKRIEAVGHRVAHGGEFFSKSVIIDDDVKEKIERCSDIAPLHNPANLSGIVSMEKLLPGVPQVAVFDTSFHQTMPPKAYLYALPYEYYLNYGIRRYGFHGTSHKYVAQKACSMTGLDFDNSKIITCHMGNGVSITAIENGKSIDTSMGFTPLEGLMMGTRCGDLDGGIITWLQENKNLNPKETNNFLNKDCGLQGFTGISSDMRDLWKARYNDGNMLAATATDMFIYRAAKYVGAYAAAMNGTDMVVYTGGIGENDWAVRSGISGYLGFLGAEIDEDLNKNLRTDKVISKPTSKVKLVLAETNEELVIAVDTVNLVKSGK